MKLLPLLLSAALANAATYNETINLKNAGNYVILAKSGIDSSNADVIGDIGISPIAATAMTGFGLTMDESNQHSTSSLIEGRAFAPDYYVPAPAVMTEAVLDMQAAYTSANLRTTTDTSRINLNGGAIGGETLTPGVYTFTTGVNIDSDLIFDGEDDEDAVFIIQTTGVLTLATSKVVFTKNKAQAKNIFWVVAGNVAIQASSVMQGVLLVKTDVVLVTDSTLKGRILAQTAVNLQDGAQVVEARVDVEAGIRQDWVDAGTACDYVVLSKSGITNIATSQINGNMGTSPISTTGITGFALTLDDSGQHSTSAQVDGEVHAANYGDPIADTLRIAVLAMQAAYTDARLRLNDNSARKNIGGGDIGGLTLTPGVYTFDRAVQVQLDVIFEGGPNDVFIIQSTGVLSTTAGVEVILKGGVQAKNIIWQFADYVEIRPDTIFQGIVMSYSYIAMQARASLNGAAYAQKAVTLDQNTITGAGGMCDGGPPAETPPTLKEYEESLLKITTVVEEKVDLGTAVNYAVLVEEKVTTTPTSTITGNIGLSPGQSTNITGFGLTVDSTLQFAITSQISGKVFAADYEDPVPDELAQAVLEMTYAYNDAKNRPNLDDNRILLDGEIGGMVLTPGIYTIPGGLGVNVTEDITLEGGPDDVFIIQVAGPFALGPDTEVILGDGVNPDNVFWQIEGPTTIGTDAEMKGVILAGDDVLMEGGSNLEGRVLSQRGVDIQMAVIGTEEAFCT